MVEEDSDDLGMSASRLAEELERLDQDIFRGLTPGRRSGRLACFLVALEHFSN